MDARKTYPLIDIMKFVFAILIIAIHIPPLRDFSNFGNYMIAQCLSRIGVPFFFMAAGYFLFRKMDAEMLDIACIKRYVIRIFLMLAAWTMIYLPLILWDASHSINGILLEICGKAYKFILGGNAQFHLWFLHALIVAVVLVAILIRKQWSFKKMIILALLLHCVALLGGAYHFVYLYFFPDGSAVSELFYGYRNFLPHAVNGVTEGFLYVALGAALAVDGHSYSRQQIYIGCALSWLLFIVEAAAIKLLIPATVGSTAYIFLIPAAVFSFLLGEHISITNKPVYMTMRKMSMYVYFIHPWFIKMVALISKKVLPLNSLMQYILVVILSLISARVLVYVSRRYKNKFLSVLG